MNALRHGLMARHFLLPGERSRDYEAHVQGYFRSLQPRNPMETGCAIELADLGWRLKRLLMIEAAMMKRNLALHVEKSRLFQRRHNSQNVLFATRAAAQTVEEVLPRATVAEMGPFFTALEELIPFLGTVENLAADLVPRLEAAEKRLTENGRDVILHRYKELAPILRNIENALVKVVAEESRQLELLEAEIAGQDLLLDRNQLTLIDRYRRLLDQAVERQLGILATTRSSTTEVADTTAEVRLRIVKA